MEYMTLLNNNNVHDKFRDKKKKKNDTYRLFFSLIGFYRIGLLEKRYYKWIDYEQYYNFKEKYTNLK